MCKPSCCTPKGNSGIGQLIAIIVAVYLAADVLSALLGLLVTLIEITLITITAAAVLGLTTWALIRRHRRNTITTGRTAIPARRAPAALPGTLRAIQTRPAARLPGAARPAPALTSQRDQTTRHFTAIITNCDDPAAVEAIRRALQGTTPDWP